MVFGAIGQAHSAGSPSGFDAVYHQYYGWVFSYFLRRGFRREVAAEFTQDVFLCVYAHDMHTAPQERFVPWLITVAKNKAVSEFRRKESHIAQLEMEDSGCAGASSLPNPEAACSEAEKTRTLAAQIRKMPEMMRRCVTLRYYHGMRPEEMAAYLGLSENTVKTHLKRALAFLRVHLVQAHGPERARS